MSHPRRVEIVQSGGYWWATDLPSQAEAGAEPGTGPAPPLAELAKRLHRSPEDGFRSFPVAALDSLDEVTSAQDFILRAVKHGPSVPTRLYEVEGHEYLTIVVPEAYAATLDRVRETRLRLESGAPIGPDVPSVERDLLEGALPEDLFPALDALPCTDPMLRSVTLLDQSHPLDAWLRHARAEPHATAMEVGPFGDVTLYRARRSDPFASDLRHAWAHLLPRERRLTAAVEIWRRAQELGEDRGPFRRWEIVEESDHVEPTGPQEQLAVELAEVVLHPDGARLDALMAAAPIRTLAMGRVMGAMLGIEPWRAGGVGRGLAEARVERIAQGAQERALDRLVTLARDAEGDHSETAAQLLVLLGEGARLRDVGGPPSLSLGPLPADPSYLEQMRGWTWLRSLDLTYWVVKDAALRPLPEIGPIESLTIRGYTAKRPPVLGVLQLVPSLKRLNVSELSTFWDEIVRLSAFWQLENLPWLETLVLPRDGVSDRTLEDLHSALPNTTIILR